ncbi:hypothetical protein G6F37_000613 [Rhizopus arrhizus]|nr:hypothetical protein G6F38_002282 [Rhizopus arrhizus]KAG1164086.1 hypothetical protein G6F37_000613 [Rhizopus arrhizus]
MNALSSIGVDSSDLSKLFSTRFYTYIVHPKLEYGLAINHFTRSQLHALDEAQGTCIRRIYGALGKTSIKVMLHLSRLPFMPERVSILQAQFLFHSLYIPEDMLLSRLLLYIQCTRGHQWYLLSRTSLWKMILSTTEELDTHVFKSIKRQFLRQNLNKRQQKRNSKLISSCRLSVSIDPIMWLPMSNAERSRCIRWRLGWLPSGKPRPYPKQVTQHLSKDHAVDCLTMH